MSAKTRNFHIKPEVSSTGPNTWRTAVVSVFEDDTLIGSYERNYAAFAETTFYPFHLDDRWYALYSTSYTATRVMSLPDCRDLGGEEPHAQGFCPVEYYVPRFRPYVMTDKIGRTARGRQFDNRPDPEDDKDTVHRYDCRYDRGPWQLLSTGFVRGCIWGDDSSWKLELLDLSRTAEGIIRREARFGYVELPDNMTLKNALDFTNMSLLSIGTTAVSEGDEFERIRIIRQEERDLRTGRLMDPHE